MSFKGQKRKKERRGGTSNTAKDVLCLLYRIVILARGPKLWFQFHFKSCNILPGQLG
jgi:hypothetical protein